MKILTVTLRNLNSLYGRWSVDFTNAAYEAAGIFAITGPTGAGKSTLLDAMCLALYGRTPRIEKISQRENEVMSRRTGECDAEVTFSCASGKFTCKWHQHRSRKSPSGALQGAAHEISDDSGNILSAKLSQVAEIVEEKTGLSFERFTRSVMLAQGRFGAFLESGADARAPILEQITGTEIYSEISIAVHERKRLEDDELKKLSGQFELVQVLSEDERREKKVAQKELAETLLNAEANQERLQAAIAWRQTMASLEKEAAGLRREAETIREERILFAPKQSQLKLARKAASLATAYRELALKRAQVSNTQHDVESLQMQMPEIEAAEKRLAAKVSTCEEQLKTAQESQREAQAVQQRVRELDVKIQALDEQMASGRSESSRLNQRLNEMKRFVAQKDKEIANLGKATEKSSRYIEAHKPDEKIAQSLGGIEATIRQMQLFDDNRMALENEQRETLLEREGIAKELQLLKDAVKEAAALCATHEDEIKKRNRRIHDLEDGVPLKAHQALLKTLIDKRRLADRVRQLEDERKRLTDGVPCPLCGATQHPYAAGQLPQLDEVDAQVNALEQLIDHIVQENAALGDSKDALATRQQALQRKNFERERMAQKLEECGARMKRIVGDLEKVGAQRAEAFGALQQYLKPFYTAPIQPADAPAIMDELNHRLALWRDAHQSLVEASEKRQQLLVAQKAAESTVDEIEKNIAIAAARTLRLEDECTPLRAQRQALYGDKSPDEEAVRCQQRITVLETECKKVRRQREKEKTELTRRQTTLEKLTCDLSLYAGERDALESVFAENLTKTGFLGESDFVDAAMTPTELEALEASAQQLDDRSKSVQVRLADKSGSLEKERARGLTEQSELELHEALARVRGEVKKQSEALGAVRLQLREDEMRRKDVDAMRDRIETQRNAVAKWQRLHALIGSSDGKKYRNFAQTLTFRRLITYANVQLARMTDRYLLCPSEADSLEFNVMDNHQAGEFRSTRNLSGGESFIVSLALALGLSQMSSQRVQIDSLFLDEGFGTLDDDALETALDTLSSLHQQGKLIGIISHVPALKDRISCQIQVVRQSGGKSRLQGPGCEREL